MSFIIPISSQPLISLSASYPYDGIFDLKPEYYLNSETGYYGIRNPILDNIKDVKVSNDSLFFITSAVELGNVIEDAESTFDVRDMVIFSSLKTNANTYFKLDGSYIVTTEEDVDNRSLFRFIRLDNGLYKITDINNKYWTIQIDTPWEIKLELELEDDTYRQQTFELQYIGNSVYIKTKFTNLSYPTFGPEYYERFVAADELTGRIGAIGYVIDDKEDLLYELYDFGLGDFTKGYDPDSIYVKYHNQLESPENNKNIEFAKLIRNTKNNLFVDSPYKTAIDKDSSTMDINIANLKNIQTPEYEYTQAPYFVNETITQLSTANLPDAVKRREYNQLFMGSNQERGYLNPCLGFNADTKELKFDADKVTYFHYPQTAPQNVPIEYIGFTESGAVPGNTPARADKVWKKLANYEKNIWWGNSTHSAVSPTSAINYPLQQGTWLCSWLSGNNIGAVSGQWMDRWYYPGFASVSNALTMDTTFWENTGALVWDEPSQMTMDGGCWYKYFHFGDNENDKIVTALSDYNLSALRLQYSTWDGIEVDDESIYTNKGTLNGYTESMVDGNVLNLNGETQYSLTPYNTSYKVDDKLSVVSKMKFADWGNIQGHDIISNGVNNGWKLKSTNGYFTPALVVFEKTYGHLLFLNNDGEMYADSLYPVSSHAVSGDFYGDPTSLAIDEDLTIWATNNDPNGKRLYKASYDGIINTQIAFASAVNLTEVSIDMNKNAWVLDTTTNTASGFAPDLSLMGTVQMTSISAVQRIDFDTQNNFLSGDYTILDRCIDSENNIFELRSGTTFIYKNNTQVYRTAGVTNIACDNAGILWVLKDGNRIVKTKANSIDEDKSGIVGNFTTGQRRIVFTNEFIDGQYKNFAWVLHSAQNKLFKVDENCTVVKEITMSDYVDIISTKFIGQDRASMVFDINGDSTGYRWQTKYSNHQRRIEAQIVLDEYLLSGISLTYPVSNFVDDEYYNISFTYDEENAQGNLYVNTLLVDSVSGSGTMPIYYKYNNSMIVGGDMGNSSALNEELNVERYGIKGRIDGLRIYNSVLNNFDIKHIELLDYKYRDMYWNMPVGVQSFIEEIERFFKHKLPGQKSQFYNITLSHLNITNIETRAIIEEIIRETVLKVSPVYTELYRIIWE